LPSSSTAARNGGGNGGKRLRDAVRQFFAVYQYSGRALTLVWTTSRRLTLALAALSLAGGLLPAGLAWVGRLIVDAVVRAAASGAALDRRAALVWVGLELGLVVSLAAVQRGLGVCQSLLRALLGERVNELILEKALTLELVQFEDSELYDKMTQARREASSRPLSLVMRTFGLLQNGLSMFSYGALLLSFSGWAVLVLVVAAVPVFVVETRFSGEAFRLFRWRTPEAREQLYLEAVIAREDYAKEVMLYQLGPRLLGRYRAIFERLFGEDRRLTLRRGLWGFVLGLLSTGAFYGAYAWIALAAIARAITLGQMTMYLAVFKQGQSALSAILAAVGGMYEDNLYLSNLYEFLDKAVDQPGSGAAAGPAPGDGLRVEHVSFTYPGAERPALSDVTLHLRPGQKLALVGENGSGKTTLIKLVTRLYQPTAGRILLDGLELRAWEVGALRRRIGVIFQDFVTYQFKVGENIGAGDVERFDDEKGWEEAAVKGLAQPFIEELPRRYHTQLGKWFKDGQELSVGQWQKVALARAFMRKGADLLVLDEPTASMDAEAEARIFERFREMTPAQMAVLISHRFSTVRMADEIIVLGGGRILEQGTHESLMHDGGHYARLFSLQAAGYR
jgi:ABC-type multidrug transport system fused ATPase/permease subunit